MLMTRNVGKSVLNDTGRVDKLGHWILAIFGIQNYRSCNQHKQVGLYCSFIETVFITITLIIAAHVKGIHYSAARPTVTSNLHFIFILLSLNGG